eukprot:sb/3466725/
MSWAGGVFEDHTTVVISLISQCLEGLDLLADINSHMSDASKPVHTLRTLLNVTTRGLPPPSTTTIGAFLCEENTPLDTALKQVDFSQFPGMTDDVEGDAFAWLTCICQSTMFSLVEVILRIPSLTGPGCKQLCSDVSYISNVMGALEIPLSRDITDISRLLNTPVEGVEGVEGVPKMVAKKSSAVAKATTASKAVLKGGKFIMKKKKVMTSATFRRPKTKITARKPKYARKSVSTINTAKLDKYSIIRNPLTTESAMKKIEDNNTLVFLVNTRANKPQIKQAVKQMYDIEAAKVNTLIRPDGQKKAYVRLTADYDALDVANKIGII